METLHPDTIYSPIAEKLLIGSILLDPTLLQKEEIVDSDFADKIHRKIFSHIRRLAAKGKTVDYLLLMDGYRDKHPEAAERLRQIIEESISANNFQSYFDVVKAKASARRLTDAARDIEQIARSGGPTDEIFGKAQQLVFSLTEIRGRDATDPKSYVAMLVNHLDDIQLRGGQLGLMTGIPPIDKRVRGFRDGDLIIVAGRPSMGKTTYALNVAQNAAEAGKRVLLFSLEMSIEQVTSKIVSAMSGIQIDKFMDGTAPMDPAFALAATKLSNLSLKIDDTPGLSINQISARARRAAAHGVDMIIVDYIGLIEGDGDMSRTENVTRISAGLKRIARELKVPVVALAQLNRGVEQRVDKRPMLSDLRDSGTIEQDADIVQFLFRPEYYDPSDPSLAGRAEVITAKFRMGKVGTDHLLFDGTKSKFSHQPSPMFSALADLPY